MVYPLPIFLNFQTNISKCLILWILPMISITDICVRDILGISSFHSASGPCRLGSLAAPSDPGCHCLLCGILHHCDVPLLSRSQCQPPTGPPDEGCPAQTATAIGSPRSRRRCFPSCPTRRLHLLARVGTCRSVLTELVWDDLRRPRRNKGITSTRPSTLEATPRAT